MKLSRWSVPVAVTVLLLVTAVGFFKWGQYASKTTGGVTGSSPVHTPSEDPGRWSMADREAATRRHIAEGLKAGSLDPVTGRRILHYFDPMMPDRKFDAPAKSPFMNMMLVPAFAGSEAEDTGTLSISPRITQNLGIRTSTVTRAVLQQTLTAPGNIIWNERSRVDIQARATGFVERLHVRAVLDRVTRGQAVLEIYVPDWVSLQADYLLLRKMQGADLESLRASALHRMRQAGMDNGQIAAVEQAGTPLSRFTVTAPRSGIVTELAVREGSTIATGQTLLRINGIDTVWAHADVPERQASLLHVGDPVTARAQAHPGKDFPGTIDDLLPEVNASTRTRTVRVELANTDGRLVAGMFIDMAFRTESSAPVLLVPAEAVIRTGARTLVMLEEEGNFRPAQITTGYQQGDQIEVQSGLTEGQHIVISGQFLLDSESSLRGIESRTPPRGDVDPTRTAP